MTKLQLKKEFKWMYKQFDNMIRANKKIKGLIHKSEVKRRQLILYDEHILYKLEDAMKFKNKQKVILFENIHDLIKKNYLNPQYYKKYICN